jgi:hypothetical protein
VALSSAVLRDGAVTATPHLSPALALKLAKILRILGSAHDGEIAAAGRRATAMVKGAWLAWGEVIAPAAPRPEPSHRPSRRWHRVASPTDSAALCLQWSEVLTDWETDFCRSIVGKRRISAKQAAVLERIARKVEAFARATGED